MDAAASSIAAAAIAAVAMTTIVAIRYLLSSGAFAVATRLRRPGLYSGQTQQIAREIGWSLISAAIYGVPAGIVAWGWQTRGWSAIYSDPTLHPWWWMPLSVLIYLFAHDTYFYWTHRAMHRPFLFARAHAVHHASRPPTAWAAMSFHPWEALSGAIVIPALALIVPIHIAMLGIVLLVMTVMGVANHIGWEAFPRALVEGPVGRWLITATHHQRHHRDYRCNYGLYFRFWDHLCGTDRGLGSFDR